MLEPILYIDDEPINLEGFELLFNTKYKVYTAISAYEAYKILAQNEIKVVISDQRMPEISGIELLEVVKNEYPNIVRILLTAYLQEEYLFEAINRGGVYRYITKPWNHIELDAALQSAIEKFNLKEENLTLIKELKDKVTQISISEEKFRNIFNSSREGIVILGSNAEILNANLAISKMLCSPIGALTGQAFAEFLIPEQRENFLSNLNNNFTSESKLSEFQLSDFGCGTSFVEIKCNPIEYDGNIATIMVLHDITEKKLFEKKLYSVQLNAEEKERERIAKDLHDGIGPLLSTLKIYLFDIQKSIPKEFCNESVLKSNEIINDSIATVKEISNNISPHILRNFGLTQAIKEFIDRLRIAQDLKFHFTSDLNIRVLDIVEISLYRITTELINNTLKYAQAKNIYISILLKENNISFNYRDDGIGFDYNKLIEESKGFGLKNIQSRVRYIGGEVSFISHQGKGVNVTIKTKL